MKNTILGFLSFLALAFASPAWAAETAPRPCPWGEAGVPAAARAGGGKITIGAGADARTYRAWDRDLARDLAACGDQDGATAADAWRRAHGLPYAGLSVLTIGLVVAPVAGVAGGGLFVWGEVRLRNARRDLEEAIAR